MLYDRSNISRAIGRQTLKRISQTGGGDPRLNRSNVPVYIEIDRCVSRRSQNRVPPSAGRRRVDLVSPDRGHLPDPRDYAGLTRDVTTDRRSIRTEPTRRTLGPDSARR